MIRKCKEIDIIVGIPSYNEADNIAHHRFWGFG